MTSGLITILHRGLPLAHAPILRIMALLAQDEGDNEVPWQRKLMTAGLLLGLACVGLWFWRNSNDFRVSVAKGKVRFHGRFPPHLKPTIAEFLLRDVALADSVSVIGHWASNRVLRISFQGKLPMGEQQRIRNFMKMTLKG